MIKVTVYKKNHQYVGIKVSGHAGYATYGNDIICAGVSALVINTVNSIETFTDNTLKIKSDENSGLIAFKFKEQPESRTILLMDSLILGLQGIKNDNKDKEYIKLIFKEV